MKKLLLGWLAVGCFATSAFAASCSIGDVATDWATQLLPSGTPAEQAAAAQQIAVDGDATTNTAPATAMDTTRAIVANIDVAGGFGLGGVSMASINRSSSVDAFAAVAAHGYNCGWELWVNPFATWANQDRDGIYSGYDADIYGANLGLTKRFNNWYVGIMGGYAYSDVDADGSDFEFNADNWTAALYAGFNYCNFFVDAAAGYTWADYSDRKGTTSYVLSGTPFVNRAFKGKDADGRSWFADVKVGYDFKFAGCWTLTPSVGFTYIHTKTDGYWDFDVLSGTAFRYNDSSKYHSSRLPIMVKLQRDFGSAAVFVEGGYIRELNDDRIDGAYIIPGTGAVTVNTQGRKPDRNFGKVGAGVKGSIGRFNVGLKYDYEWSKDTDAHTVQGLFGITF